jgi:hypothetical protein
MNTHHGDGSSNVDVPRYLTNSWCRFTDAGILHIRETRVRIPERGKGVPPRLGRTAEEEEKGKELPVAHWEKSHSLR